MFGFSYILRYFCKTNHKEHIQEKITYSDCYKVPFVYVCCTIIFHQAIASKHYDCDWTGSQASQSVQSASADYLCSKCIEIHTVCIQ